MVYKYHNGDDNKRHSVAFLYVYPEMMDIFAKWFDVLRSTPEGNLILHFQSSKPIWIFKQWAYMQLWHNYICTDHLEVFLCGSKYNLRVQHVYMQCINNGHAQVFYWQTKGFISFKFKLNGFLSFDEALNWDKK